MSNLHLSMLILPGDDPSLCEYLFKGDKSQPHVVITFSSAPLSAAAFEAGLREAQQNVKVVPGLADAAVTFGYAGSQGLSFLSGNTIVSILATVPTAAGGETALARAILNG
jgi:hypothetical protein